MININKKYVELYMKIQINTKLLLPIYMQHPKDIMNPNLNVLKQELERNKINYNIVCIGDKIIVFR